MKTARAALSGSFPPAHVGIALQNSREALLKHLSNGGHWIGHLSSSALSTAVASVGLSRLEQGSGFIESGLRWLARDQNGDGGWGDTPDSPSNLSTTLLCWAAFHHDSRCATGHEDTVVRAESFLRTQLGTLASTKIASRVIEHYGKDRTFSVPILTLCALCDRLGSREQAWGEIPQLPFELAALPHQLFQWLRLPVVSYAIPALIAIGLARHENAPRHGWFLRGLREAVKPSVLSKLHRMQPSTGGFLEATPLTGFVVMSLAASGLKEHPVTKAGGEFLRRTQREDGSWPIDVDLNTWLTSLSVQALKESPAEQSSLSEGQKREIVKWLLAQQHRTEHPFTHAQPGGWAWTNLAGGVPDGDDTAGALLSLHQLAPHSPKALEAAVQGVEWLLDLQNRDGGVPTFCRGWLNLPFDESCPDITAHALAAWSAWRPHLPNHLNIRVVRATSKALNYLLRTQKPDGTWRPLWFGSQSTGDHSNPLYGTARVLMGLQRLCPELRRTSAESIYRAQCWLLKSQNADGGWGAAPGAGGTIEETALALDALSRGENGDTEATHRGLMWLLAATKDGTAFEPSPIGLYFSKLWYSERLYPIIFTCSALQSTAQRLGLNRIAGCGQVQDEAS